MKTQVFYGTINIMKIRVGIFGGTFNPPHNGHIRAADAFYQAFLLDRLIVIPANIPPHKEIGSVKIPAVTRLEMTQSAFSCDSFAGKDVLVSDIEIRKSGPSYSFDTVTDLRKIYSSNKCDLFFLVGSDMYTTLDKWHRFRELMELCVFVGIRRGDDEREDERLNKMKTWLKSEGYTADLLTVEPFPVSSTEIRAKLQNRNWIDSGESELLLPINVRRYIKSKGSLY
ncbi:putative nicotinate-nucleotide adenylyltransferase [Clostridia bacterium]|nr:putative nicotinate-nucleotide adenylyltransferase [Clostridia bacterium]